MRTFPHILSNTPELVRDIEELTFTPSQVDSLFLITGDVEGLYANIQQDEALATVGGHLKRMLQGGQSNPALRAEVLRFAMNFVFKNAYVMLRLNFVRSSCKEPTSFVVRPLL